MINTLVALLTMLDVGVSWPVAALKTTGLVVVLALLIVHETVRRRTLVAVLTAMPAGAIIHSGRGLGRLTVQRRACTTDVMATSSLQQPL